MEQLKQMIAGGMEIVQARIINIGDNGQLLVKTDLDGIHIACDFLKTHAGPLPQLYLGTPVLCIANETRGYVLGVIQAYTDPQETKEETPELKLSAGESIELTCGESMLSMNKDGKIILRGADITTRASGQNKIKGATVSIN